jgi:hypothetical protein
MKHKIYLNILLAVSLFAGNLAAQTGGQFSITQSATASGGGASSGGAFQIETTAGQAVAGGQSTAPSLAVRSGFWTPDVFAPTAAEVSVSGRITAADGRGIRNVRVTVTDMNGQTRMTISSSFGYFRFDDLPVGETYIFTVHSKRFQFAQPTRIITLSDAIEDLNFIALE